MAFLALDQLPADGYAESRRLAANLRKILEIRSAELAASDTNADVIISILYDVRAVRDRFNQIAAIPGIVVYAQSQEDNADYDVVAEFTSLVVAMEAVLDNIVNTFPKDASGFLLEKKWDVDMNYVYNVFTPAQTVNLRDLIDAVIASIS